MKKRIFAAIIAAVFVVLNIASALPAIALDESTTRYPTPEGYNDHDYQKLVAFLEQTDEEGMKNGERLSEDYDPNDPETWGSYYTEDQYINRFQWIESDGELRICQIDVYNEPDEYDNHLHPLWGTLDVSGCITLERVDCRWNNLTTLDVGSCTALTRLNCGSNQLTSLDVSSNTALMSLYCFSNQLTSLDVSNNTELLILSCWNNKLASLEVSNNTELGIFYCYSNQLTELDVSNNTMLGLLNCSNNQLTSLDVNNNTELVVLDCSNNQLTSLDISNNDLYMLRCHNNQLTELDLHHSHDLRVDYIKSEGNGTIGYSCSSFGGNLFVYAVPDNGAKFIGWYNEKGELIKGADDCDYCDNQFAWEYPIWEHDPYAGETIVLIAKFTEAEIIPGDADGDGELTTNDSLDIMRIVLGVAEPTDGISSSCDMNGDGVIDMADALLILRIAVGIQSAD
ncbi:MAG: hypothetical protein IKH21_07290 [Clostridia bacterium]|nr:hypothetical protein [Clostridia bacterium]